MRELTHSELSWVGAGEFTCTTPAGEDCMPGGWIDLLDRLVELASSALQALSNWWNS